MRLTPAYSLKLVTEVLERNQEGLSILDPFSGTGTTVLVATALGHEATGVEVNPFLVWLGNAKVARYSGKVRKAVAKALCGVVASVDHVTPVEPPAIHNIDRWWHPEALSCLCSLRQAISDNSRHRSHARNVLDVVFCRTMIEVSNAAFNHQSMSFADPSAAQHYTRETCLDLFRHYGRLVSESLLPNPRGRGKVVLGDSRGLHEVLDRKYDLMVTSPPYPNRMSYIRELRPYMYWLGYLSCGRDAGELDWQAIGGTWGVATSRVSEWESDGTAYEPAYLSDIIRRIAAANNKYGDLLSRYVRKYFHDMWHHMLSLRQVMNEGGVVVYIIGNSTFYGVAVPSERIYADMLRAAGFSDPHSTVIRKRNSKKELFEYAVEATLGKAAHAVLPSSAVARRPSATPGPRPFGVVRPVG